MSSFTMLKKNSRFESACPSSGPITFCEGDSGHVYARSPATSTHAAAASTHAAFVAPTCASLVALNRLVPHPCPATFCEGDSGHVYARSPATSKHAAFVAPTCAILSASGRRVRLTWYLADHASWWITRRGIQPFRRCLWVSRLRTLCLWVLIFGRLCISSHFR